MQTPHTDSLLYEGSLKSFQDAVNLASIVSVTDVKGNIIYANELFCDVSQYTLEELIGKNHRLLNSGYHSPAFFKELWQTIASGNPWRGQIKNRAKDGSFYWVDSVITPVFNDNNEIVQYLSVRNIISEQKENENFRDSVFSALMVGIAVINKEGLVVSSNNSWTEF
jgi:PAS domain S-box-containing protein